MKTLKVHAIIPGKLYQRGEFVKWPLQDKLKELRRLRVSIIVNLWNIPDILLKDEIPHYYHLPIPDSTVKDGNLLIKVAKEVAQLIREGNVAIVHCHAGRNRSGLFNALVCMELLGISGKEAVERVRRGRPNSLANENFVKFLIEQGGDKLPTRKIIAIGGVPGSGKTLLVKELMDLDDGWESCSPAKLLVAEYNQKLNLYILGKYEDEEVFSGTDRLSMAVQPNAQEWIKNCKGNVLFEGDRLFNGSFLNFLLHVDAELFIVYLNASEKELKRRYQQRGSNQSAQFLKGRETKYNTIKQNAYFRKFTSEFIHETPEDTKRVISIIREFLAEGKRPEISKPVSSGIMKFLKKTE